MVLILKLYHEILKVLELIGPGQLLIRDYDHTHHYPWTRCKSVAGLLIHLWLSELKKIEITCCVQKYNALLSMGIETVIARS